MGEGNQMPIKGIKIFSYTAGNSSFDYILLHHFDSESKCMDDIE